MLSLQAVDPNDGSDYISPPPDGPLLPLPPSAIARPFETGSAIHGGQIALRTRAHRPGANHRSKPRPAAIRTQSGNSGAGALPTPVDHQSMLLSPSARQMQPDYSQGPSVLQGSPRGESLQSAQDYQNMMSRGYGNDPHPMPLSAGGRMESYGHQPGMDYGNNVRFCLVELLLRLASHSLTRRPPRSLHLRTRPILSTTCTHPLTASARPFSISRDIIKWRCSRRRRPTATIARRRMKTVRTTTRVSILQAISTKRRKTTWPNIRPNSGVELGLAAVGGGATVAPASSTPRIAHLHLTQTCL